MKTFSIQSLFSRYVWEGKRKALQLPVRRLRTNWDKSYGNCLAFKHFPLYRIAYDKICSNNGLKVSLSLPKLKHTQTHPYS